MAATERFTALDGDNISLTIQEVSRRSGLSEPTLRYYEKIGLIEHVGRDESSGHRRYGAALVNRIEALACLRATGMSVHDMRLYLRHLDEAADGQDAVAGLGTSAAAEMTALFERNVERLDAEIERLLVRRDYLRLKAEIWAARRDGDEAAEHRAIEAVVEVMDVLR
jgi:MerR family transcriptional regulator, aldehyde-responsive regulator